MKKNKVKEPIVYRWCIDGWYDEHMDPEPVTEPVNILNDEIYKGNNIREKK